MARAEGMLVCPEGAAAAAVAKKLRAGGFLDGRDRVLILNTGTGLKYPELIGLDLPVLPVGAPLPSS